MASEGFDPRRSKVSDNTMATWLAEPIRGDITEVPGIGNAAAAKLADHKKPEERITNTYQLFGKYLMLKGPDTETDKVGPITHNEKFWYYLKDRGISAHRSAIVRAVAEKASTFFLGIYDPSLYDEEEEED